MHLTIRRVPTAEPPVAQIPTDHELRNDQIRPRRNDMVPQSTELSGSEDDSHRRRRGRRLKALQAAQKADLFRLEQLIVCRVVRDTPYSDQDLRTTGASDAHLQPASARD